MTRGGSFKRRVRRVAKASDERYTKALADARLVDGQRTYYDLRAPDYGNLSKADRKAGGMMPPDLIPVALDKLAPHGDLLELACGPGGFTGELARRARSVTAVDGSPSMLERNRLVDGAPNITYVEADLFEWKPDRSYDQVFFAFWLSHVPPSHFDAFWAMVRQSLKRGGRVGFVDEDARASGHDDVRVVDGTPVATRTLADGGTYNIVKVFWESGELEERLRSIGWNAEVCELGDTYILGIVS